MWCLGGASDPCDITNTLAHLTWLVCSIYDICVCIINMRHVLELSLLDVHFHYVSLQRLIIKLLCNATATSWILDVIQVVLVNHVIHVNTNLVHPTWFTPSIPGIYVCNVSMRHVILDFALLELFILVLFCCNNRWLNCFRTTTFLIRWCKWSLWYAQIQYPT
jgi:hypothetical protein